MITYKESNKQKGMTTKKLFQLLTLVGNVRSTNWENVRQLVTAIADDTTTVKDKQWCDSFKREHPEYYSLKLELIETWSTYDKCFNLKFFVDKEQNLVCEAVVYNGELLDGLPTNKRFTATIVLPNSFIRNLEQRIEWAFDSYLEDAYEAHLEELKRIWIENKRNEIVVSKKIIPEISKSVTVEGLTDDDDKPFDNVNDADEYAEIWYPHRVKIATKDGDKLCETKRCNARQPDGAYSYYFSEIKE